MRYLISLFLLVAWSVGATSFTEFYCDANIASTNLNSGDTTNAAPDYISVAGNWNGTDTFTPTDGTFPANSNAYFVAGRWASVVVSTSTNLVQAGSKGGWISKILTINSGANGTIVLSTTAFAGTAPSSQTGTAELRVGGAWHGPYGTAGLTTIPFPFGFIANTATNGSQRITRVNFRNGATYSVLAAMTHSLAGPMRFQGMTASPGDGGKATFDAGGLTGSSIIILTISGAAIDAEDFIFSNNGDTGTANGLFINAARNCWRRVVVHDIRGHGFVSAGGGVVEECEAYACNKSNTANTGGFNSTASTATVFNRCYSHDNAGSLNDGFVLADRTVCLNCISESNGRNGFTSTIATSQLVLIGCDSYNNGAGGYYAFGANGSFYMENCNFVKNGTFGITNNTAGYRSGNIINCGFGAGTMTNTLGGIYEGNWVINEVDNVTYPNDQSPWVDPDNQNFNITLSNAKSTGRGAFTQSQTGAGTIAHLDIGAGQAADTNSTPTPVSYTFAQ